MGLRESILGATTTPREVVALPALDINVTVRGMTGRERDAFEASCFEGKGKKRDFNMKDVRAKLLAYCCLDEKGNRLFSDADVQTLGDVRADVLDRLFGVAQRLSGMSDQDIDDLGKPSASPIVSGSSSSASPTS